MTCREAFEKQMDEDFVEIPSCWTRGAYAGQYMDDDVNEKWELWQQAWKASRAEMRKQK